MSKSPEASPHPVQLGGQSLSSDNAGQHVFAVQTHVVLNARLGPRHFHSLDGGHHALVHTLGPAESGSARSLRHGGCGARGRPEGVSFEASTEGSHRADFTLRALFLAELSSEGADGNVFNLSEGREIFATQLLQTYLLQS